MKSRVVNTKFWTDTYISELQPNEKLLFIYLITNTLTNICGVYEISIKQISFDTGISITEVNKILEKFTEDKKIIYYNGWIAIKNFIKNQNQGSPQVQKGIDRELTTTPMELQNFVLYGIDTVSYLTKLNLTKLNLTKPIGRDEKKEKDFIDKIVDAFSDEFKLSRNLDYISNGKDRSAVGKLLTFYKNKNPDSDSDKTLNNFKLFFKQCLTISDKWYYENMSLSIINSKINEIRTMLNKKGRSNERDQEIWEAVNRNFGD